MTQRRIDMHTRLLMMEFFWFVFCPLFLLQQTKKKKRKICGRGKNVGLGLAKVSLSLQTVSRLLFFFVGS